VTAAAQGAKAWYESQKQRAAALREDHT
jgi:hypothetical protein